MTMCYDLSIAGVGDELAGNPGAVRDGATGMQKAGEKLNDAGHAVDTLVSSSDEITSKAFKALGEKGIVVTKELRAAGTRYQAMAKSLREFADVLESAQREANQAAPQAHEAKCRRDQARQQYDQARMQARTMDEGVQRQAVENANRANAQYRQADGDFNKAVQTIRAAAQKVREANEQTARKIEQISNESGVEDSWWDRICAAVGKVLEAIGKVLQWIWDNLDLICLILDIVCLVLMFIPVLNIGAAAIKAIATVAKVFQVLSKGAQILSSAKSVIDSAGKAIQDPSVENIGSVMFSIGGVALGVFGGRGIAKSVDKVAGKVGGRADAMADALRNSTSQMGRFLSNPGQVGRSVYQGTKYALKRGFDYGVDLYTESEQRRFRNNVRLWRRYMQPDHVGVGNKQGGGGW